MADLYVFARNGGPGGPGSTVHSFTRGNDRYFIVLELTPDCFFRWTRTSDGWHKLFPRVPIPSRYQ